MSGDRALAVTYAVPHGARFGGLASPRPSFFPASQTTPASTSPLLLGVTVARPRPRGVPKNPRRGYWLSADRPARVIARKRPVNRSRRSCIASILLPGSISDRNLLATLSAVIAFLTLWCACLRSEV